MKRLTITGNVGKEPETVKIGDKEKIKFSVGVYAGKDKNGNYLTDWFDVVANAIFTNIHKGSKVLVEGSPSVNAYISKLDSKPKASVTIYSNHIEVFNAIKSESSNDEVHDLESDMPF